MLASYDLNLPSWDWERRFRIHRTLASGVLVGGSMWTLSPLAMELLLGSAEYVTFKRESLRIHGTLMHRF
jgi:hypothetical protein